MSGHRPSLAAPTDHRAPVTPAARGPATRGERTLAPDLARGAMLLLIVLANTPFYLYDAERTLSSAHPLGGSVADRVVQALIITTVDARVYPMFAFLFGYGIVQLYRRQGAAGVPEPAARRVLRRRHWWLLAFGFVHAALLWMGDIVGAYAVLGLLLVALFLRVKDTTLVIWVLVMTSLIVSGTVALALIVVLLDRVLPPAEAERALGAPFDPYELLVHNIATPDYLASIPERLIAWAVLTGLQGFALVIPTVMLLAFWAARRGILEDPRRHHRLLVRVAAVGIAVGWLGALPHALDHVGVLALPDRWDLALTSVQATTGMFCGIGYVALFGLLAERLSRRGRIGAPALALAAVGQRSLSCYLAQSVLCAPLLAAWGLGLGGRLGSAAVALLAIGVWLLTVAGAVLLDRAGRRGPAETLLRRLAYGGSSTR